MQSTLPVSVLYVLDMTQKQQSIQTRCKNNKKTRAITKRKWLESRCNKVIKVLRLNKHTKSLKIPYERKCDELVNENQENASYSFRDRTLLSIFIIIPFTSRKQQQRHVTQHICICILYVSILSSMILLFGLVSCKNVLFIYWRNVIYIRII